MRTILVADDHSGNREILRMSLECKGYRVIEAADGEEAVDLALRESPDLLLLDIQMPRADGYQTIRSIRQHPDFQHIPAIAVTAFAMTGDKEKALDAGFNAHISKPINIEHLRRLVADLLLG
ncbi:MAG: response regulator [Acidobacteria bacterium]|nr:response regulator [Acidobacteriota bacterium]